MFYVFTQNNSGGRYIGPHYVCVEADNATDANMAAQHHGLVYFDGVQRGRDCRCCGDRWYKVAEHDAVQHLDRFRTAYGTKRRGKELTVLHYDGKVTKEVV